MVRARPILPAVAFALVALVMTGRARADYPPYIRSSGGAPMVMIGPSWSLRAPYQLFGIGATADVRLFDVITIRGLYQYGFGYADAQNDSASDYFEALAGVALLRWYSTTTESYLLDQAQIGDLQITSYRNLDFPTSESLIAEAGVMAGERVFDVQQGGGTTTVDPLVWTFAAGVRYIYYYNVTLVDGSVVRNHAAFWAHLLLLPQGIPTGDKVMVHGYFSNPEVHDHYVGVRVGCQLFMWANAFASVDVEAGYTPTGDFYLTVGNTVPFWIM